MAINISCTNLAQIAQMLSAAAMTLAETLQTANDTIAADMDTALIGFYGPHLAKRWNVEQAADDAGAFVRVWTDDEYVRGYEFGTRAHVILPRNKMALAFQGPDGQVITKRVNHPGTRGHHHADEVRDLLFATARDGWMTAIMAAFENL